MPYTYDEVVLNEPLAPTSLVVTPREVRRFAYAVDDSSSFFTQGETQRLAHPTLLGLQLNRVALQRYQPVAGGGFHGQEEMTIVRPPRLGERVTITGMFVDKYVKGDLQLVVLDTEAKGDDGGPILRGKHTLIRAFSRERLASKELRRDVSAGDTTASAFVVPSRVGRNIRIGAILGPIAKSADLFQVIAFHGTGSADGVHTDDETARSAGLREPILHSWINVAYISELLTESFGVGWLYGGQLSVRFAAPAYVNECLSVSATVVDLAPTDLDRVLCQLDVRVVDPRGVVVVKGTAQAWIA